MATTVTITVPANNPGVCQFTIYKLKNSTSGGAQKWVRRGGRGPYTVRQGGATGGGTPGPGGITPGGVAAGGPHNVVIDANSKIRITHIDSQVSVQVKSGGGQSNATLTPYTATEASTNPTVKGRNNLTFTAGTPTTLTVGAAATVLSQLSSVAYAEITGT